MAIEAGAQESVAATSVERTLTRLGFVKVPSSPSNETWTFVGPNSANVAVHLLHAGGEVRVPKHEAQTIINRAIEIVEESFPSSKLPSGPQS